MLDNLEQVLAAAPVVADLVARVPGLTVVATSRAPLRVRAERELPIGPLALPMDDEPESVSGVVRRRHVPRPRVGDRSPRRRDPRRTRRRSPPSPDGSTAFPSPSSSPPPGPGSSRRRRSSRRLERPGPDVGLRGGPRDLPDRQRTMTAVLDWSADLLEPEESDLLARLSVFSGGFSLDSVEAVVAASRGAAARTTSSRR